MAPLRSDNVLSQLRFVNSECARLRLGRQASFSLSRDVLLILHCHCRTTCGGRSTADRIRANKRIPAGTRMELKTNESGSPNQRPTLTFQVGKFRLTGWRAGALLGAIVGAIGGTILAGKSPKSSLLHFWTHNWPMVASFGLWMVFSAYWGAAAKNSATAKSSESLKSTMFQQVMMNVALLLLFIPVPGMERRFLPAVFYLVPLGLGLQASFILLAVWARRCLGKNWSAEVRVAFGHELIRTGPYRLIRHPIYSAMLGMFIGTAIVSGCLHALAGVALLALAYARKIRLEERRMSEEFGAAYSEYRRVSWALVPWLI